MDGMLPKLDGYHWERDIQFIMFDDMHNIFKVTAGHD